MSVLRPILGDQLSHNISSLIDCNKANDVILLCEVWDEATYVKHHKKKIAFVFSAMRHFANELRENGYNVHYTKLDDPANTGSFKGEVARVFAAHNLTEIIVTEAGEYRVLDDMHSWADVLQAPVSILPDIRFLCGIQEFADWAGEKKQLRMEFFYREMRKKYQILMDGEKPEGGQWNYDAENRKSPEKGLQIPPPHNSNIDSITNEVLTLVEAKFPNHFGDLQPFNFAVTRQQALQVLRKFIDERLKNYGDFQDAMIEGEPWMYHAHISFYLNCGLLEPLECARAAEDAYYHGNSPLNAVEGFIRQIIGWREYIRGIYWLKMPKYAELNFFDSQRKLPDFYWTGTTKMNCLSQCVSETKQNAYAHHIQRLMVLGNFALLAGIDPKYVNEWFLIVYADAYEWVELPNVSGMILFADGGYLASKPYAAGGAYINKMSDYCKKCAYKVSIKNGENACPFNYLYWDFMIRNEAKLKNNPRIGMMYKTLQRMDTEKIEQIKYDSNKFLTELKYYE